MSSPKNVPKSPQVRLVKLSSAQPLLLTSKTQQKMLHRLALIIQESAAAPHESTRGKLPIEAAYIVMKKVTESAKAQILPVGLSTFNKLESLRTDPAVDVLKRQSWKEFFTSTQPGAPSPMKQTPQTRSNQTLSSHNSSGKEVADSSPTLLDVMLDTLIGRVESLWEELKFPDRERRFYRKSLCKFPAQSLEQGKELAIYITAVQNYKQAIRIVLQSIKAREKAIKRCYDVLLALNRKYARIVQTQNFSTRPPSASSTTPGLKTKPDNHIFWKEELLVALDEVRCSSLDVIKAVQSWRRLLWRPQPFIYRGQNYLLKMASDMNVLESDVYQKLLGFLPLAVEQLLCVVFRKDIVEHMSNGTITLTLPPSFQDSRDSASEDLVQSMIREFVGNIDAGELAAAAKVVLQEDTLQKALQTEQASLSSKGVFIPLIKVNFTIEGNEGSGEENN